jgi:F0F1-type ATP synthase assembly protein I
VLTGPPDSRKELGFYLSLAQVGLEMVVPVVAGIALDHYLHSLPWGTVSGAALGPLVGIIHLVVLQQRFERKGNSKRQDSQ